MGTMFMGQVHIVKTWPALFDATANGVKTFDIREDDRIYRTGDILIQREWDPATNEYTGRILAGAITYVMPGGRFGLSSGSVALGVTPLPITVSQDSTS